MQSIQFREDTLEFTQSSYEMLDQIVVVLKVNNNFSLEIQGHTDNIIRNKTVAADGVVSDSIALQKADSLHKVQVSEGYADLVKKYLTSKGVNENRLIVKGFGDTKPVATNNTPEGRNKNRRVELMIVFDEIIKE
jgi:outer membrane protein OmpA-like peptidoglycan-associated protein